MKLRLRKFLRRSAAVLAAGAVACFAPVAGFMPAGAEEPAEVVSVPETVISGIVRDSAGRPVAGARVWMMSFRSFVEASLRIEWKSLGETTSDADGKFQWHWQRPIEDQWLWITPVTRGPDKSPGWGEASKVDQATAVSVTLRPTRNVQGRLVDVAGMPIGGAKIRPVAFSGKPKQKVRDGFTVPEAMSDQYLATTKGDGEFTIIDVPATTEKVSAEIEAGEYGNPSLTWNVDKPATLRLARAGTVRGRLNPVPQRAQQSEIRVQIVNSHDFREKPDPDAQFNVSYSRLAPFQPDGSFEFTGVPPGKYQLYAVVDPRAPYVGKIRENPVVEITPAAIVENVAVPLIPAVAIRGRVIDRPGGKPVAGAVVTLFEPSVRFRDLISWRETMCFTNKRGQFQAYVAPGEFFVRATSAPESGWPRFTPKTDATLTGIAGKQFEFPDIVLDKAGK